MTSPAHQNAFVHLAERSPQVTGADMVASLVPPPQFADASFDTYRADEAFPSQAEAKQTLREFACAVVEAPKRGLFRRAPRAPERKPGV